MCLGISYVILVSAYSEMFRIATLPVSARVQDKHTLRDRPIEYLMGHPVYSLITTSTSGYITVTMRTEGLLPNPAVILRFHIVTNLSLQLAWS